MTKQKFMDALLDAICAYASLADRIAGAEAFVGSKAGCFYGMDNDGTNQTDHYILIQLADGSCWRVIPERTLKMEPYEQALWDKAQASSDQRAAEAEDSEFDLGLDDSENKEGDV